MIKKILLFCTILTVVYSCGFKGPLYLPKKDQTPTKIDTTESSVPAMKVQNESAIKI